MSESLTSWRFFNFAVQLVKRRDARFLSECDTCKWVTSLGDSPAEGKRERERERERGIHIYIYVYIHIERHVYVYIRCYMDVCRYIGIYQEIRDMTSKREDMHRKLQRSILPQWTILSSDSLGSSFRDLEMCTWRARET